MRRIFLVLVSAALLAFTSTTASAQNWNLSLPEGAEQASKKRINAPKPLYAVVDISKQRMYVYERGRLTKTWKVSTGTSKHPTPKGSFPVTKMFWKYYSTNWGSRIEMPYSVFFKGANAIHGTKSTHRLGSRASHGCIRLTNSNAYKFYQLVQKYKRSNTRIKVQA